MKDYKFPYQFKTDILRHKLPLKTGFIIKRRTESGKTIRLKVEAHINFKFSCDPEPLKADETGLFLDIYDYLHQMETNFWDFIRQNLDEFLLHLKFRDKISKFLTECFEKKTLKYYLPFELGQKGFFPLRIRKDLFTSFGLYLHENEEEIFKLIRSKGPRIIRNFDIQKILLNWIRWNERSKINRFFKTLKDWIPSEKGGPRKGASPKIWWPSEHVKEFYNNIRLWLRQAKKNRNIHKDTLKEWNTELEKIDAKYDISQAHEEQKKFMVKTGYWILRVIDFDEELNATFYIYDWSPHDLAKRILAKFLNVEEETIRSILYR